MIVWATSAAGSAVDDGSAGLDALKNGDYDRAITLFTRAINSGELSSDDKEFAYLNRGRAYTGKHQYAKAIADLKKALKLNPNDTYAQDALADAQSGQSGGSGGARADEQDTSRPPTASQGWGVLGTLAGRYFWYEDQSGSQKAIIHYDWLVPQQVLHYVIRSKDRVITSGEYKLDPSTGVLIEAQAVTLGVYYGTVTTNAGGTNEYFFVNNTPLRVFDSSPVNGAFVSRSQRYINGAWQDLATVQYVELSLPDAQAAGFFK